MRRALRYLVTAPSDLLFLVACLILWPFLGGRWEASRGCLWLRFTRGQRWWRFSTTLCHIILFHPNHGSITEAHELEHVKQWEGDCLSGLALAGLVWAAGAPLWASMALWTLHGVAVFLAHYAAAWARGGDVYRDSVYERLARWETEGEA